MRSGSCSSICLFLAAALFAAAEPPERAFEVALRNFTEQHYEDSARVLRDVVKQRPRWFDARFLLGASLVSLGRSTEAIEQLEVAHRLRPSHLDCTKLLASEYLKLERATSALTILRPPFDEELYMLAIEALYMRNNDTTDAQQALALSAQAVKRYPHSARLFTWRGYALRERGELSEAKQSLEAALKIAPDDVAAAALLADVIRREGHYEEALSLFDRVLKKSPEDEEAIIGKSHTLTSLGKTAEALELVSAAVKSTPDVARLRVELSQLYAKLGDRESSAREASEFRRLRGSQKEQTIPSSLRGAKEP